MDLKSYLVNILIYIFFWLKMSIFLLVYTRLYFFCKILVHVFCTLIYWTFFSYWFVEVLYIVYSFSFINTLQFFFINIFRLILKLYLFVCYGDTFSVLLKKFFLILRWLRYSLYFLSRIKVAVKRVFFFF